MPRQQYIFFNNCSRDVLNGRVFKIASNLVIFSPSGPGETVPANAFHTRTWDYILFPTTLPNVSALFGKK